MQAKDLSCLYRAYDDYRKAYLKGDDKKKQDWLARKSCTYMTESVDVNMTFTLVTETVAVEILLSNSSSKH